MNWPNRLTIIRLFLVLPFLIVMGWALSLSDEQLSFADFNTKTALFISGGAIFSFAMLTDWLDGRLARKNDEITNFGKLFDPIADKFMTSCAFIMLALLKITPFFVPIILILRDIIVDGSRNLAAKYQKDLAANVWGKLKTLMQFLALMILFFVTPAIEPNAILGFNGILGHWQLWLLNFTALLAIVFSLYSGAIYVRDIVPLIKINEDDDQLD